ncbi:MAG: DUF1232 domain-containing protein [Fibromonadaceae bacterium]|jgi:uncharacterized membrane protein YkvA (DUF1232 family)|nr:DUF1232 domain-containing protein [Fibromonadaceae bacterium]
MNSYPDSTLILVACIAVLAVCILIFVVVFKIALLIKNLKIKIAAMAFSALYVASPIDLIPFFIPIFGQIDDAGALAAFVGLAFSIYSDWKKKKKQSA